MDESRQPTHHGYAVNVKDRELYAQTMDRGALTEGEVQAVYEEARESFWQDAQVIGKHHELGEVYGKGRMGGWATPSVQPSGEESEDEIADYVERFRAFERDVLAAMAGARDFFAELLADKVAERDAELAEIDELTERAPEGVVVAGPAGHWYAMLGGELVARPIMVGETRAPEAPLLDADGNEVRSGGLDWYAPDDLRGEGRRDVLAALCNVELDEPRYTVARDEVPGRWRVLDDGDVTGGPTFDAPMRAQAYADRLNRGEVRA